MLASAISALVLRTSHQIDSTLLWALLSDHFLDLTKFCWYWAVIIIILSVINLQTWFGVYGAASVPKSMVSNTSPIITILSHNVFFCLSFIWSFLHYCFKGDIHLFLIGVCKVVKWYRWLEKNPGPTIYCDFFNNYKFYWFQYKYNSYTYSSIYLFTDPLRAQSLLTTCPLAVHIDFGGRK